MTPLGYTPLTVRETAATGHPKPRLLDRVREAIRARHYNRRTEKTYVAWIKRYIFFHGSSLPNSTVEQTAGSHALAAAAHRGRSAAREIEGGFS